MLAQKQRSYLLLVATIISFCLFGLAYYFGWFSTLEAQLTDRFFTAEAASAEIVIIDIDETSLAELGQWPWPRAFHATLLEQLSEAKVVGFDVIFSEPSALGAEDDQRLVEAIQNFPGQVVLPQVIDEQSGIIRGPAFELADNVKLGFVNTRTERDGIVRYSETNRGDALSFDAVITNFVPKAEADALRFIYYLGPASTYNTISYLDVYLGRVPASAFGGKIVLVGASAPGLGDIFQTPFGVMSGVEIRANTINTIQSDIDIKTLPLSLGLLSFLLIAGLVFWLILKVENLFVLYGSLTLVALTIIVGAYTSFAFAVLTPHFYQFLLFVVLSGTLLLLQYVFEANEKRFIRRGFEQYVAPSVVAELTDHPEKLSLGGEERTLSILFSDIRGFTTISEKLTPSELMNQLNEYLEEMSEAVMERKGLVDKYIGDAVMAFWGAPLDDPDHVRNACESVLAMMESLRQLNERWIKEGKSPFKIGVGISTGDVVVGNMGSKRRFNYSIIGDEVNFAARIEGLTKEYGVSCLIGQTTYDSIKNLEHLPTRELDEVMVKGKVEPRRIYELITEPLTQGQKVVLEHFALGRTHYKAGDFKAAMAEFNIALLADPEDGPSKVFLERSEALLREPPANWNGVFEFKTK